MKNIKEILDYYLSAWNAETPDAVKAHFLKCCTPEITYTDRNASTYTDDPEHLVRGIDQFTDLVMGSHAKIPGRTFSILSLPQYFEGHCHYSWGLHIPGQEVLVGWDYFQYNDENQITKIIGFLPEQP